MATKRPDIPTAFLLGAILGALVLIAYDIVRLKSRVEALEQPLTQEIDTRRPKSMGIGVTNHD